MNIFAVSFIIILLSALVIWEFRKQNTHEIQKQFIQIKKVLLIIAHPDDETMFFIPTIKILKNHGIKVFILSLTNGGSTVREHELQASGEFLECPEVYISGKLIDGMKEVWDLEEGLQIVLDFVTAIKPDAILTFDEGGVSGHVNHVSTHSIVRLNENQIPVNTFLYLKSYSIFRKYLIPLHVLMINLEQYLFGMKNQIKLNYFDVVYAWKAFGKHASQTVWFRYLFIVFSIYSSSNTLMISKKNKRRN